MFGIVLDSRFASRRVQDTGTCHDDGSGVSASDLLRQRRRADDFAVETNRWCAAVEHQLQRASGSAANVLKRLPLVMDLEIVALAGAVPLFASEPQ